jgi:ribulose-bisphosphate carboxylase small chain
MRVTQGTFSFLPDLTDEEIEKQIKYALENGWAMMVEYTDDPHPRNSFWEMWKQPDFDLATDDVDVVMKEIHACRKSYPNHYIKVQAYDSSLGRQSAMLSFIVNRPEQEPGFRVVRQEKNDRAVSYTVEPYVHQQPIGRRYGNEADLSSQRDPAAVQDATPDRSSPLFSEDVEDNPAPYEDVAPAQKDEGVGES